MKYSLLNLQIAHLDNSEFMTLIEFLPINYVGVQAKIKELSDRSEERLETFSRLNLSEFNSKPNQIKQAVSSQRYNYDIISVEAISPALTAFAARDNRVDIIRVSEKSKLKEFNTRYGRRIDEYNKLVELDISFIWKNNFAKFARPILRILKSWENCKFPILLTHEIEELHQIRSYPGLQSIGRILGIPNNRSSTKLLIERINRNQKKIKGLIPIEGVEIGEW